jgi:hypothetical protein
MLDGRHKPRVDFLERDSVIFVAAYARLLPCLTNKLQVAAPNGTATFMCEGLLNQVNYLNQVK